MKAGRTEVKQAINRLSAAFGPPRIPEGTLEEFYGVLVTGIGANPTELSEAVGRFIAKTEKSYGFPTPASIKQEVIAHRAPEPYRDRGQREKVDVRSTWQKYVDLDELKRLNDVARARTVRG